MKLDFFSFLLPFQASIAPGPQFEHGHARKLATPADLQADVAGLIAMSRTLWLETLHATKDTSEEAGKDIINDIVVEANTLIVYNHTASQTKPVRDNRSSRSLFAGIDTWEHQTAAFLDELTKSAQDFKETKLNEPIASNLTTLKTCSIDFCHNFEVLLPGFKDSFSNVVDELVTAFDNAIDALNDN